MNCSSRDRHSRGVAPQRVRAIEVSRNESRRRGQIGHMLPANFDEWLECCRARAPCRAESQRSHVPPCPAEDAEISGRALGSKGIVEPLLLGPLRALESGGHCEPPASELSLGKHRRVTEEFFP